MGCASNTGLTNINADFTGLSNRIPSTISFLSYRNAETIVINLGYTPSAQNYGQAIIFNANQNALSAVMIDGSPTVTKWAGNITFTITVSGQTVTLTPSARLWGVTTVLLDRN